MNNRNFLIGMGMGLMVGGAASLLMRPKKPSVKNMIGRTLKSMGEMADDVSDLMGW